MPLDANIILGAQRPRLTSPQDMAQAAAVMQQNQLANRMGEMKMQEYERGIKETNALADVYRTAVGQDGKLDRNRLYSGAAGAGLGAKIPELQKKFADQDKDEADTSAKKFETASKRLETMGQALGWLKDNPSPENARQALSYLASNGVMDEKQLATAMQQLQANPTPQGIAQFATLGYQASLKSKDQLATYQTRNTGGTTDTLAINPVTGKVAVANSVRNTQSPDSIASQATAMRGQNMADARAREGQAMTLTKPFEITGEDGKPVLVQQDKQGNIKPVTGYLPKQGASKPLTDSQSKALLFGARMQESGAVLDELASQGLTKSVPGSRTALIGPAITAMSGEKNQKLEQAKRDFINATLRRESGAVIADSEFDNAEKQYFPQIGDTPAVIAQKKKNREVATRGILAEVPDSDNRVSKVRGGATGDFSAPSAPAAGGLPSGWKVQAR